MARNYAVLLHEYLEELEPYTDEEVGRITRALLRFSITGEEEEFTGNERYLMKRIYVQERRFQEHYGTQSHSRSEAGKKGAASRWMANDGKNGNTKTNTETKTETNTNTETEPKTKPQPKTEPQPKALPAGAGQAGGGLFEAFWANYPSARGGRKDAEKAWRECVRPEGKLGPRVLEALEIYRKSQGWLAEDGRFVPAAGRFLRERMWEKPPRAISVTASCSLGPAEIDAIRAVLDSG